MATTKTAPKKRATAKKSTAKKSTAKKAAPKATAEKAAEQAPKAAAQLTDRLEDAVETIVKMSRDTAHAYVGFPFVVQDRVVRRSFGDASFAKVMTEARERGEERVAQVQAAVEPVISRVSARIEPVTDRIESALPTQVRDAVETSRERVRKLVAV